MESVATCARRYAGGQLVRWSATRLARKWPPSEPALGAADRETPTLHSWTVTPTEAKSGVARRLARVGNERSATRPIVPPWLMPQSARRCHARRASSQGRRRSYGSLTESIVSGTHSMSLGTPCTARRAVGRSTAVMASCGRQTRTSNLRPGGTSAMSAWLARRHRFPHSPRDRWMPGSCPPRSGPVFTRPPVVDGVRLPSTETGECTGRAAPLLSK